MSSNINIEFSLLWYDQTFDGENINASLISNSILSFQAEEDDFIVLSNGDTPINM